ncbi:hypothetical protein K466DRAFT_605777 [Polyporus arcularius HHB13444]|uniref:Uncharacterized protein n=1 Tax=Polyporus arcularius HHB13444 TaxID=1314778 RepID=A0A5C3NR90_9APHY|nr:hypothetical protein K466DRAFT_605777 [Polyporus arcularius HHB13444]
MAAASPAVPSKGDDTEWQRRLSKSRLINSFRVEDGRADLETVHYPCDILGVAIPLSNIVEYCRTHDFVEGINCFCEGVHGIRRAVRLFVPTGGVHRGEPSLRCFGGCSYYVNLQELVGHGDVFTHMAVYPEVHQVRKRKSIRDIFGSQITPRRPTGPMTFSTPRCASTTPRAGPTPSRVPSASSSRPRSTSFLGPARDSSPSDCETNATLSSSPTTTVSSPVRTSSGSVLKRKRRGT